jgi:hypothetical protein
MSIEKSLFSLCCSSPVSVEGSVTKFFRCTVCGKACDADSLESISASLRHLNHQRFSNIVSGMLQLGFSSHPSYDMDPLIEGVSRKVYDNGHCIITCPIETFERLVFLALGTSPHTSSSLSDLLSLAKRESESP